VYEELKEEISQQVAHELSGLCIQSVQAPKTSSSWLPLALVAVVSLFSCAAIIYKLQDWKSSPVTTSSGGDYNALSQRIDLLAERQWLLGVAINNNAALGAAVLKRSDPEAAKKYVGLDSEWRLDREPEMIETTTELRERIRRYLSR
jgi:hypothetical protein